MYIWKRRAPLGNKQVFGAIITFPLLLGKEMKKWEEGAVVIITDSVLTPYIFL